VSVWINVITGCMDKRNYCDCVDKCNYCVRINKITVLDKRNYCVYE